MVRVVAVDEKEALKMAKAGHRVISSACGLLAFTADNSDTNIRLLDHRHVVPTISNGERDASRAFDEAYNMALLLRRHSARHHLPAQREIDERGP